MTPEVIGQLRAENRGVIMRQSVTGVDEDQIKFFANFVGKRGANRDRDKSETERSQMDDKRASNSSIKK